jgi:hypothetical protein
VVWQGSAGDRRPYADQTGFSPFRARFVASGHLTDEELTDGKKIEVPDLPKLQGAESCELEDNPAVGFAIYNCYFLPSGPLAVDIQKDYVRLVRLVEQATGTSVTDTNPPFVSPTSERRTAYIVGAPNRRAVVTEQWNPEATCRLLYNFRDSRCGVSVSISQDPPPGWQPLVPTASGNSEIDRVIQSGRYAQMPALQRVASSGSGPASVTVTNDTAYALSLVYEGPVSQTLSIPSGATETVRLTAGTFRVLGRVPAPSVLPFIGNVTLGAGDQWTSSFHIK